MFRSGTSGSHPVNYKIPEYITFIYAWVITFQINIVNGNVPFAIVNDIPPHIPLYLQEYLEKECQTPLKNVHFKKLGHGLTLDETYTIIDTSHKESSKFILKILSSNRTLVQRQNIVQVYRTMDKLGIGPKVHFSYSHDGILLLEYIQGRHLQHEDFKNENILKTLLSHLKKYHQNFPLLKEFHHKTLEDRVLMRLQEIDFKDSLLKKKLENYIQNIKIQNHACLVHSDLKPSNILITKDHRIFIIDWADCHIGNPLEDLGSIVHHFNLTAPEEKQLTKIYYGRLLFHQESIIFEQYKILTFMHSVLWALRQSSWGSQIFDIKNILKKSEFHELLGKMYDGVFLSKQQLAIIGHHGISQLWHILKV